VGDLLNELMDSEAYNQLPAAMTKILAESVPVHVMKAAILQFATSVKQRLKGEAFESIASQAVSAMRSHVLNFDDADRVLREALFDHFIGQEQFKEGAQMLSGVNVEALSDSDKVRCVLMTTGGGGARSILCVHLPLLAPPPPPVGPVRALRRGLLGGRRDRRRRGLPQQGACAAHAHVMCE
jgi:hypothetical protein